MPGLTRQVERRVAAEPRRRPHVGAGVEQRFDEVGAAARRRPVQRGHPVALRLVDVGALLEQRADASLVAAHGRVGHRRASAR